MASNRTRQGPVEFLAPAGEHHVLLAHDLFGGSPDAVGRGRAGRGDRIVEALDLEPGGERPTRPDDIALGTAKGPTRLGTLFAGGLGRLDDGAGRGAAGADDQAGALVGDIGLSSPESRSPAPWRCGQAVPWARKRAARRSTRASQSIWAAPWTWQRKPSSAYFGARRPGLGLPQGGPDLLGVVADGGDDPHPGDDDATHEPLSASLTNPRRLVPFMQVGVSPSAANAACRVKRPTLRSVAR